MSLISCFPVTDELTDSIPIRELTCEEYDALSEEEKAKEVLYVVLGGQSGGEAAPAGSIVPTGGIIIWSGASDAVPEGWALCDGSQGTPDLRGRFVLGSSDNYTPGSTGGEETHTLTVNEIPSHKHSVSDQYGKVTSTTFNHPTNGTSVTVVESLTQTVANKSSGGAGGGSSHNNMPPYYVMCYIMKL